MTTLAQRITETPMAPYMGLIRSMTHEQKQIVVKFITESMEEPKETASSEKLVAMVRKKFNVPESPTTKWFREHAYPMEWDKQEEWNKLTPEQKAYAERLNFGVEDMDPRTVGLIIKYAK